MSVQRKGGIVSSRSDQEAGPSSSGGRPGDSSGPRRGKLVRFPRPFRADAPRSSLARQGGLGGAEASDFDAAQAAAGSSALGVTEETRRQERTVSRAARRGLASRHSPSSRSVCRGQGAE